MFSTLTVLLLLPDLAFANTFESSDWFRLLLRTHKYVKKIALCYVLGFIAQETRAKSQTLR